MLVVRRECSHAEQADSFRAGNADPASWIKPGDKPLTFRTMGQQKDVLLVPIKQIVAQAFLPVWT